MKLNLNHIDFTSEDTLKQSIERQVKTKKTKQDVKRFNTELQGRSSEKQKSV